MVGLSLASTVKLSSGFELPLLGLGVFRSGGSVCINSVLEALKVGYRHIDSAVFYGNEREVGEAIRLSGIERGDVFVSSLGSPRIRKHEQIGGPVSEEFRFRLHRSIPYPRSSFREGEAPRDL